MTRITFGKRIGVALALALVCGNAAFGGAPGGPKYGVRTVLANNRDAFSVTFRVGEEACIVLCGDHDTDLDIYVYDCDGKLVAWDENDTDEITIRWRPKKTQKYTVRIVNRGDIYNQYEFITN